MDNIKSMTRDEPAVGDATGGLPICSVIIPCRNEARFIDKCLDSIVANNYPKNKLEILVVDGISDDGTRDVVGRYVDQYDFIKLFVNPKRIIPTGMNIGIRHSRGDVLMKMDAHSTYPPHYIETCVRKLDEYKADNVGGVLKMIPRDDTAFGHAIALVLSHPFGSGNAYIKIGSKKPRWADTVSYGCYRREVFKRIGLWNEDLPGSSDMDFNTRLREAGGKILLSPDIVTNYFTDSNLKAFWKHNFADGVWATYVLRIKSNAWRWRHWVPLCFISSLLCSAGLSLVYPQIRFLAMAITGMYIALNAGATAHIVLRKRSLRHLSTLPIAFAVRHVAHGLGALLGLFLVVMPGQMWQGRRGRVA